MKTGIVITFYNKEKNIDLDQMELFLNSCNNIQVCFVNNGSTDNTIDTLEQISEKFPEIVSVVNIKNNKGEESALKVGFRYLLNKNKLAQVSYFNRLNFKELNLITEFSPKMFR